MKFTTFILGLLFPIFLFSNNPDSLFQAWNNQNLPLQERGMAYNKFILRTILYTNPDSALVVLDELENFAEENDLKVIHAKLNGTRAIAYAMKSDFDKALEHFHIKKDISESIDDIQGVFSATSNIATVLMQMDSMDSALDQYFQLEERKNEIESWRMLSQVYGNIGTIYGAKNNFKPGIEYLNKSYNMYPNTSNERNKIIALNSIAECYAEINEYEQAEEKLHEALSFETDIDVKISSLSSLAKIKLRTSKDTSAAVKSFEKALALAEEHQVFNTCDKAFQELVIIYEERKDYEKSMKYLDRYFTFFENNLKNPNITAQMLGCKGKNYLAQNNLPKAEKYCKEGLQMAQKMNAGHQIAYACECLMDVALKKGDYASVYSFANMRFDSYAKAVENEQANEVVKLSMNYEFDREKAAIVAGQQLKEDALIAQTKQTRTAAAGIGALALLGFGFFWNARRDNKTISAQNEAITEKNQQLEQLNQTKDRIFAIIGHDLRKPAISFNNIAQTVRYLLKKQDFATLEQYGAEIQRNAQSLTKMTDNLLKWALTQRDVMPYNPEAIQVSEVTNEITEIFAGMAADKNVHLEHHIASELKVYADRNALRTIIINLVDNAIKYTPNGGQVDITAAISDKGVQIEVTDTGVGIPAEKLQDIFLLQKGKSEKGTAGEKGTGLGMHLVQELAKLNKGAVEAFSQLGRGSQFKVLLPQVA